MKYNYYYFYSVLYTLFKALQSLYIFIFLSIINSGWWIVKPKGASLQNCVCSTLKSAPVIILSLVCLFLTVSPKIPKWGVLANRLKPFNRVRAGKERPRAREAYTRSTFNSDTQMVVMEINIRMSVLNAHLKYEKHFRGPKAIAYLCLMGKSAPALRCKWSSICTCSKHLWAWLHGQMVLRGFPLSVMLIKVQFRWFE